MSGLQKRSVTLAGHRTSIALEEPFWEELDSAAKRRDKPLAALVAEIDRNGPPAQNLASALRVFVVQELRRRANNA